MDTAEAKIPQQHAVRIRELVHEVANALEAMMMSHYLLVTSAHTPQAGEWLQVMEQSIKKAAEMNRDLGTFIRQHS